MKPNELKKLLKVAKTLGVKSMSMDGMHVEFFADQSVSVQADRARTQEPVSFIQSDEDPEGELSYEEMLLRSSPAFDLMQEAKGQIDTLAQ